MKLNEYIRIVPDFPKDGINFYDIAPLMADPVAWKASIQAMAKDISSYKPDMLIGIESRGFLVAAPLAIELGCGFGMIRKKGKLPGTVLGYSYDLEYGSDTIEIQPDLIPGGAKIVVVDDLLATGGTMGAAEELIRQCGAQVAAHAVLIELDGLNGRDKLTAPFHTLMTAPA